LGQTHLKLLKLLGTHISTQESKNLLFDSVDFKNTHKNRRGVCILPHKMQIYLIICLLLSHLNWPKVIVLSGAYYCIHNWKSFTRCKSSPCQQTSCATDPTCDGAPAISTQLKNRKSLRHLKNVITVVVMSLKANFYICNYVIQSYGLQL
jgi:hypothetical protein